MPRGAPGGKGRARVLLVGQDTFRRRGGFFPGDPRVSTQGPHDPVLLYCRDAVHLHGPAPVLRANPGDIRGGDVEARPRQLRNSDGGGVDVRRREHHVDDVRVWVVCHPKP